MSTYDKIDSVMLNVWLIDLTSQFNKLAELLDEDLLCYLFLKLHEYIICLCKLRNTNSDVLFNTNVKVNDIKIRLVDTNYNIIANNLLRIRNSIGHGNRKLSNSILKTFNNEEFYNFLVALDIDHTLITSVKHALYNLSNICNIRNNCKVKTQKCLDEIKGTSIKISEVISDLSSKYPSSIVSSCILEVLGNDYIV